MKRIDELLGGVSRVGIAGHVNPDGDCVGSCTALLMYIRSRIPDAEADLYLEMPEESVRSINGFDQAKQTEPETIPPYDLFIVCDVSSEERIGVAGRLFREASKTACIDHHISNAGFADVNHIEPDASSCSEILALLMDPDAISTEIAESLYTGIIHDCGVFQYSSTSPRTMRTAAMLMEKGVSFSRIIDETFNSRTFDQERILGHALEKAETACGGRVIYSYVTLDEMERYHVTSRDVGMIVPQLRYTSGTEAAVFLYEKDPGVFKVSLRSSTYLDVSSVAAVFGGGGHIRAAGCTLEGSPAEIARTLIGEIGKRLK